MNTGAPGRLAAFLPLWTRRLFHARISDVRCTSLVRDGSVTLPDRVLSWADEMRISIRIQRPTFSFGASGPYEIRLPNPNSCAEPDTRTIGAPEAIEGVAAAPAALGIVCVHSIASKGSITVGARFKGNVVAGHNRVLLEVRGQNRRRPLCRLGLEVLDETRAQRHRVETVSAENRCLWIQSGNRWHPGDSVPDTSDFLVPEFTVPQTELGAILPDSVSPLEVRLAGGPRRIRLNSKPITLGKHALRVRVTPIPVRDTKLFPGPGRYSVVVSLAGRDIAAFPFRILTRKEWLKQLQIKPIALEVETADGRRVSEPGSLQWRKHVAFRPCLRIETGVPAPNTLVRCDWRLTVGDILVGSDEFLVRLEEASRQVRLRRFDLRDLAQSRQTKRLFLQLSVRLDDEQKVVWPMVIGPSDRVSDFEGQLCCDAEDLTVDEESYNEIIAKLAIPPAPEGRSPR